MRVLHINRNYLGTTLHQTMIQYLSGLGVDNTVFVPIWTKKNIAIEPASNVIVSLCFKNRDRFFYDYKQFKIFKALGSSIDVLDFDMVHAYTLFTDGNIAHKLYKKYHIPYVVAVRNTDVNDFFAKLVFLRKRGIKIMMDAEAIFFLSETYKQQVFSKYVPKHLKETLLKKTKVIPNGIDKFWHENIYYRNEKKIDGEVKIIYAGRINKNKNIPTTQAAIRILEEKGYTIKYTVVGKIDDEDEYKRIIKDSRTYYHTPCSKESLIKLYRDNDIFVMPSFTETFGLVYAEAMSQGLPVVYSKREGFDGQFNEGVVGYNVDPYDPNDLANKIELIINSLHSITQNCVDLSSHFDWNDISQKYYDIYNEILAHK